MAMRNGFEWREGLVKGRPVYVLPKLRLLEDSR